jgi:hypothetical protein
MAFRRSTLINLGGFDHQFRQAGDDVDVCWRLLDADLRIGYVPGAMVWHHRRSTVAAFRKQQKGYGRAEAMLSFKHPLRYGVWGRPIWKGVIYGDSAGQSPFMRDVVYHGQFGFGLFQTIYRQTSYGPWSCVLSLEWHLLAAFSVLLGLVIPPIAVVGAVMWLSTLGACVATAMRPTLPRGAPWWSRPLLVYLNLMQPLVRGWYRTTYLLQQKRLPQSRRRTPRARRALRDEYRELRGRINRISSHEHDLYWSSSDGSGREALLRHLVEHARENGWWGDFDNAWADWDVKLVGDRWHDVEVHTATEELGGPQRFTRARSTLKRTAFHRVCAAGVLVWTAAALTVHAVPAMVLGAAGCAGLLLAIHRSRSRCTQAALHLVAQAGQTAELAPCDARGMQIQPGSTPSESSDAMQASTRLACS